MSSLSRLWLLLPTWLFLALDVTLTLTGQPKEYWAGDFATAIEVNPAALPILAFHPGLFAGLAVCWGGALGVVGFRARGAWAAWLLAGGPPATTRRATRTTGGTTTSTGRGHAAAGRTNKTNKSAYPAWVCAPDWTGYYCSDWRGLDIWYYNDAAAWRDEVGALARRRELVVREAQQRRVLRAVALCGRAGAAGAAGAARRRR